MYLEDTDLRNQSQLGSLLPVTTCFCPDLVASQMPGGVNCTAIFI